MVEGKLKIERSMHRPIYTLYLYTFIAILILIHSSILLQAQPPKTNRQLLSEQYQLNKTGELKYNSLNNTNPLVYKSNNVLARYNPFSLSLKGAMLFYQKVVSPQLFKSCIYELSCSNYAKHAIHQFGLFKGVFLSADRLMRCNSIAKDEIPAFRFNNNDKAMDEPEKYHFHK
jgi:putative component of membrane protein insertase Oxa1/YidC/SpoIIIJ protein YidD